jgi:hypothetical protein
MPHLIRRIALVLLLLWSLPSLACNIVYGKDWAFLSTTPEGWASACHTKAMLGTAITLWPSNQRPDQAEAFMYATVSTKDLPTLAAFAAEEQSRFRKSSPASKVSAVEVEVHPAKVQYQVVAISAAPPGDREELVAYVEGPTAFFIVVMTADSATAIEKHRTTFMNYLRTFAPMERK